MSAVVRPIPVPAFDHHTASFDIIVSSYSGPFRGFYVKERDKLHLFVNQSLSPERAAETRRRLIDAALYNLVSSSIVRVTPDLFRG